MAMTVKELRKFLEQFPDDHIVITSIDDEGNGFNELSGQYMLGAWEDGELLSEEDIADSASMIGMEPWPYVENAILLWP